MTTVGFVALGKLGLPVAVAMAERGHTVIGTDINQEALERYRKGISNLYEPNMDERLQKQLNDGRLLLTADLKTVVKESEIIFIAVQTPHPPELDGSIRFNHVRKDFDYMFLQKSCNDIAEIINDCDNYKVVVIISTVLPGTTRDRIYPEMQNHCSKKIGHGWDLIYSPSFIAMGQTISDFVEPEFTLVGERIRKSVAGDMVEKFYKSIHDSPIMRMTWAEAEGVKCWYNLYIGQKIMFANTVMHLCHNLGANCDMVTDALVKATDRLISPKYLKGGNVDAGGCLKPGELVYTSTGLKPISDISINDCVVGHDGKYHKVTKTYVRPYNGLLYKIYPEGFSGFPIIATPSHPVWVAKRKCNGGKYRFINQPNRKPKRLGFMKGHEPPSFTEISQIEHGDVIAFPHFDEYHNVERIIKLNVNEKDGRRRANILPSTFELNHEILYLFGLYIAEGSTWKREIHFAFHEKEAHYEKIINDIVQKNFKVKAKIKRKKGHGIVINLTCAPLADYLRNSFGRHSYEKSIPWDWIHLDNESLKYLLKGIWDGDGGYYKKEHYLQVASKPLVDFIKLALLKLKIPYRTKIYKERTGSDGTKHRKSYWIAIRENLFSIEPVEKKKTIWFEGDTMFCHVRKIETEDYRGPVHNLEVEGASSYMLQGGIVHNCHPRDNLAMSYISDELGLGYNVFDFMMTVREKHVEWFADEVQKAMQSSDQQVVICGRTYKPFTNLTYGSASLLLYNILLERGIEAVFYDPETDPILPDKRPSVYFIGTNWPQFRTFDYCSNSTVIDPWGMITDVPEDVKLVSLGRK